MAPTALTPFFSFPGIERLESLVATDRHGITPSFFLVNVLPQAGPPSDIGDLVIGTGTSRRIWRDCLVDSASITFDANGLIGSLSIMDRRWRWRYGEISGHYNVRNKSGDVIATDAAFENEAVSNPFQDTERLPSQLVELCLVAMGERDFDIDVPNETRPEVDWELANPAAELARLCDLLGCQIALQANDRIGVFQLGSGAEFPPGPVLQDSPTFDPSEKPSRVRIHTEPIQFQWDFELEAVGLDRDESIKPIDLLDITPKLDAAGGAALGWQDFDPRSGFAGMVEKDRKLAQLSVFRWYRIKFPFTYPDRSLPNGGEFRFKEEIVLLDRQVDTAITLNVETQKDTVCYGIFYDEDTGEQATRVSPLPKNDKSKQVVPDSFSMDTEERLVRFGLPIYAYSADNFWIPATLRLRASFHLRLRPSRRYHRFVTERDTGSSLTTKSLSIQRRDLLPSRWVEFVGNSPTFQNAVVRDNFEKIRIASDTFIDDILQSFQTQRPGLRRYIGIVPVSLDGAIRTATYEMNSTNITTTIQRHQDLGSRVSTPAALMRHYERARFVDILLEDSRASNPRRRLERLRGE